MRYKRPMRKSEKPLQPLRPDLRAIEVKGGKATARSKRPYPRNDSAASATTRSVSFNDQGNPAAAK